MKKITVIDYGAGNLRSLENAIKYLQVPVEITSDTEVIQSAEKLILPGVGAFAPAMARLREKGIDTLLKDKVNSGTPLLGICLGMQLLFTTSYEQGQWEGLNLIPGTVMKFEGVKKIPHMGWNELIEIREDNLTLDMPESPFVYFVHSFYCIPEHNDDVLAFCEYGEKFAAAVHRENIWGMQFHPEKSQNVGLQILKNFAEKV